MQRIRLRLWGLAALVLSLASVARAQAPASPSTPPAPTFEERLAARVAQNRYAVTVKDGAFSGPGWDLMLEQGRTSRFFLVGEEHGIAEVPAVVRELFRALQPAGYRHLALEISPPIAKALDETARGADGLQKLTKFYEDNPPGVAFYTLREEAELLVAARAAVTGPDPVLWGLDYEMMADRFLLDGVRRRAPAGPAKAAAEALYEKSAAAFKTVKDTGNPGAFFSFSNPPEILSDLRQAWPHPDPESALVLDVLEETLAINHFYATEKYWDSNQRRADLMRRDFLRYWNEKKGNEKKANPPRVMLKFGGNHMVRGRSMVEIYDLGNFLFELAAAEGSQAFNVLVVGGAGTEHAIFNPVKLIYEPAPVELAAETYMQPILGQTLPEGFTLIDLRALRLLFSAERAKTVDPELMRIVHGYDALLILTGSHPSKSL
jgi:erythromycin esterase-like protein